MKSLHSTVLLLKLLALAALCCFFFGLGQHELKGALIQNCPQLSCKDVYCWWVSGKTPATQSFSAQVTGTPRPPGPGSSNTTHALPSIFGGATVGKTPLIASGTFDKWTWPDNTATCDKIGGSWPSPQEALPGGTATLDPADKGLTRNRCTLSK